MIPDLKPHAFVIAIAGKKKVQAVEGFLVPETGNLLAVDERHDLDDNPYWRITHLPTGRGIGSKLSSQETLEKAVKIAQGFYREFAQLCDLSSKNIEEICGRFNSMPYEKREEILKRIKGRADA